MIKVRVCLADLTAGFATAAEMDIEIEELLQEPGQFAAEHLAALFAYARQKLLEDRERTG